MSRFSFLISALLLATIPWITGCVHQPIIPDGYVPPPPPPTDTLTVLPDNPCDPDSVYFLNTIQPLINSNCAIPGCHDAGTAEDGVILDTYANIINTGDVRPGDPSDSELFEVLVETDPDKLMPPPGSGVGPLTPDQIMAIFTWIQQGALENGCDDCDTTNFTFSTGVWPIINTSCTGCHSGSAPQGGIALTNYTEVAASAASGALLGSMSGAAGYVSMPYNAPRLPDCSVDIIARWIDDGAPNN